MFLEHLRDHKETSFQNITNLKIFTSSRVDLSFKSFKNLFEGTCAIFLTDIGLIFYLMQNINLFKSSLSVQI